MKQEPTEAPPARHGRNPRRSRRGGGQKTGIAWTDATWNPTVGCTHVSAGCDHCYAAREASGRLARLPLYAGLAEGGKFTGVVRTVPGRLDQPLRWRRPRRIFVDSMSDLFHPGIPGDYLAKVFAVMALAGQHQFQVLTKRPARMRHLHDVAFRDQVRHAAEVLLHDQHQPWQGWKLPAWPLRNVWLGVSVEDQVAADDRIPKLLQTPAAVRFLSCEPLLGPVDLRPWLHDREERGGEVAYVCQDHGVMECTQSWPCRGIDWVIAGGESGPGARPMHPAWARSLRDQCRHAGVAFFMKQFGAWRYVHEADDWAAEQAAKARGDMEFDRHPYHCLEVDGRFLAGPPTDTCATMSRYGGHNGDPAGWPADLRVREYPRQEVPVGR